MTPSLSELELNTFRNANQWRETPFDANLRQLTKLVLNASSYCKVSTNSLVVPQEWVDTVRRNACPAGLEIKVTFWDWRSGETEVVDR